MHYIIVKRGEYQQYDVLYKAFGDRLPVIWDRRRTELPGRAPAPGACSSHSPERRSGTPASWVALGFVVAEE